MSTLTMYVPAPNRVFDLVMRERFEVQVPHPCVSKPRSDDLIVTNAGEVSLPFAMIELRLPPKLRKRAQ